MTDFSKLLMRNAILAQYMLSSCVCLSVCPSVTSQFSAEMAKCRITQIMPHDSRGTCFLMPKVSAKFEQGHPKWGTKCWWGR